MPMQHRMWDKNGRRGPVHESLEFFRKRGSERDDSWPKTPDRCEWEQYVGKEGSPARSPSFFLSSLWNFETLIMHIFGSNLIDRQFAARLIARLSLFWLSVIYTSEKRVLYMT